MWCPFFSNTKVFSEIEEWLLHFFSCNYYTKVQNNTIYKNCDDTAIYLLLKYTSINFILYFKIKTDGITWTTQFKTKKGVVLYTNSLFIQNLTNTQPIYIYTIKKKILQAVCLCLLSLFFSFPKWNNPPPGSMIGILDFFKTICLIPFACFYQYLESWNGFFFVCETDRFFCLWSFFYAAAAKSCNLRTWLLFVMLLIHKNHWLCKQLFFVRSSEGDCLEVGNILNIPQALFWEMDI